MITVTPEVTTKILNGPVSLVIILPVRPALSPFSPPVVSALFPKGP